MTILKLLALYGVIFTALGQYIIMLDRELCEDNLKRLELKGGYSSAGCYKEDKDGNKVLLRKLGV